MGFMRVYEVYEVYIVYGGDSSKATFKNSSLDFSPLLLSPGLRRRGLKSGTEIVELAAKIQKLQ